MNKIIEYRDLYDENRKLTGEIISKDAPIPKGRYYLTVCVFIENNKREFLLQINKKYNKWSFTGGHPKSGETSIEGIISEIKEELGIIVKSDELNLFKVIKTEDDFLYLYYLKKDINIEDIVIQEDEVGDVKWFSINQINDLIKNKNFLESLIPYYNDYLLFLNYKK